MNGNTIDINSIDEYIDKVLANSDSKETVRNTIHECANNGMSFDIVSHRYNHIFSRFIVHLLYLFVILSFSCRRRRVHGCTEVREVWPGPAEAERSRTTVKVTVISHEEFENPSQTTVETNMKQNSDKLQSVQLFKSITGIASKAEASERSCIFN